MTNQKNIPTSRNNHEALNKDAVQILEWHALKLVLFKVNIFRFLFLAKTRCKSALPNTELSREKEETLARRLNH